MPTERCCSGAGCVDNVLGCIHTDTEFNAAQCGIRGVDCRVCQPDSHIPHCASGVYCDSPAGGCL